MPSQEVYAGKIIIDATHFPMFRSGIVVNVVSICKITLARAVERTGQLCSTTRTIQLAKRH